MQRVVGQLFQFRDGLESVKAVSYNAPLKADVDRLAERWAELAAGQRRWEEEARETRDRDREAVNTVEKALQEVIEGIRDSHFLLF